LPITSSKAAKLPGTANCGGLLRTILKEEGGNPEVMG
jgi:hypothetical protein